MQRIQFHPGEVRHVRLMVHAADNEPFIIREAFWELRYAGEAEDSGECVIEGHIIDARIAPSRMTSYQLIVTYRVADETLVEKIEVAVT